MQTQTELIRVRTRSLIRRLLGGSISALSLLILGFIFIPILISKVSAAQDVSAAVNWSAVSLTLDPDYGNDSASLANYGDVLFTDIIPTSISEGSLGTQQVLRKTIAITTTGNNYQVFLSTNSASSDLTRSGASTSSIDAIDASWGAPTVFFGTSWGFAVPANDAFFSELEAEARPTIEAYTAFSDYLGLNMTKNGIGSSVYNTALWAAVPDNTSYQQIYKAETNNVYGFGTENGDNLNNKFDIYYSVLVDDSVVSGEYTNQLIYTAFASASGLDTVSNNISRSLRYGAAGDTETIELELVTNIASLDKNEVEVYLVPHSTTEARKDTNTGNYTAESLGQYSNDSNTGYECIIGDSASDFILDSTNNTLTLNCTLPANPDPTSTNAGGPTMDGEYDFWVRIKNYGLDWVSQYTENTNEVASFVYAGLQTKKRNGTDYVVARQMQSMTPQICTNTMSYSTDSETYTLTDTRDSISYNIRKFGDDCWMVSNLRFTGTSISPTTTDIDVSKTIIYGDLTSGNSYDEARIHSGADSNGGPTVWYNYAAATAMTITGSSNTTEAQYSLCPKGWKMPSIERAKSVIVYKDSFNLAVAGGYYNGVLNAPNTATYWLIETSDSVAIGTSVARADFQYDSSKNTLWPYPSGWYRYSGFFVRCVASA